MKNEICQIKINSEEIPDLYQDMILVEVENDHLLASSFRIKLAIQLQRDGTWTHVDNEYLKPWNKVEISAGFPDNTIKVITGYIVHLKPFFAQQIADSYIEIWGIDKSVVMDREEILKAWPERKDSDIASEIFSGYGLTPKVDDSGVVHKKALSTIIQRDTDIKFLKRLARRNGYECYIEDSTGYFRKPALNGPQQKVLAFNFGDETNLSNFNAILSVLQPTVVEMHLIDSMTKEVRNVKTDKLEQRQIGKKLGSDIIAPNIKTSKLCIKNAIATGQTEMEALSKAVYNEASWLLEGGGQINGKLYQEVLRAMRLVSIKGIGKTYSGTYYVTHVKHIFDSNGYAQHFKARKNAIYPDGSEDFGSNGSLPGGV
jgi:phage protein D